MTTFLVFSDDWGRHPSSCQHLARCLMTRAAHRIIWVNTIGTRPPGFNLLTLKRGFQKIASWLSVSQKGTASPRSCELLNSAQNSEPTPQILQPFMIPWFRSRFDRWLNQHLLSRQLNRALEREKDVIAITTLPITADLPGSLANVKRWVYYCVDDWSRWPGMDAEPLAKMEADLLKRVEKVVTAGENLRDRLKAMGRESLLLTHGVDPDFWMVPSVQTLPTNPSDLTPDLTPDADSGRELTRGLPHPIFAFWGLIDERLEPEMIEKLAQDAPNSSILLAGPIAVPSVAMRLERLPNVKLLGRLPYEKLPVLASEADVLLMPYRKNEATEQIQPLKMTEYLASGKPAVVRDLRAAFGWADALDVAISPETFSELAQLRARTGLPNSQRLARKRLSAETWEQKAFQFEKFILADDRKSGADQEFHHASAARPNPVSHENQKSFTNP